MSRRIWHHVGFLAALAVASVVLAPRDVAAQSGSTEEKPRQVKRGGSNLILEGEIAASPDENAYDVVQRLRPAMLRPRAPSGTSEGEGGGIVVYLDNVRLGGTESLRNVQRQAVKEIRFINAGDATLRFGTGHPSGAILVTTMR